MNSFLNAIATINLLLSNAFRTFPDTPPHHCCCWKSTGTWHFL